MARISQRNFRRPRVASLSAPHGPTSSVRPGPALSRPRASRKAKPAKPWPKQAAAPGHPATPPPAPHASRHCLIDKSFRGGQCGVDSGGRGAAAMASTREVTLSARFRSASPRPAIPPHATPPSTLRNHRAPCRKVGPARTRSAPHPPCPARPRRRGRGRGLLLPEDVILMRNQRAAPDRATPPLANQPREPHAARPSLAQPSPA